MSVKFVLSEGSATDYLFAKALIADAAADKLLADKAYDTDGIRSFGGFLWECAPLSRQRLTVRSNCLLTVICTVIGHLVENCFLDFKR